MDYRKLTIDDADEIRMLYLQGDLLVSRYNFDISLFETFLETYLTDLNMFSAYGAFDGNKLISYIATHQSLDLPFWSIKQAKGEKIDLELLSWISKEQEKENRNNFYILTDSDIILNLDRYECLYETTIPSNMQCVHQYFWNFFFDRKLIDADVSIYQYILQPSLRRLNVSGFL